VVRPLQSPVAIFSSPRQQARRARVEHGIDRIGFDGGVLQNRILMDAAITLPDNKGFNVRYPDQLPVNDAGLNLGRAIDYAFARVSSVE
jgi:hydrogenase maturation factor HypF (carbamoyltransferase family)